MRIATYNVEWFANLFDRQNHLYNDDRWSGRHNVTRAGQTAALGKVFRAIDADGIMIIEAPDTNKRQSTAPALQNFAADFDLRTTAVVTGFVSDTQQEIAFLFDPLVLEAVHDPKGLPTEKPGAMDAPRFDTEFHLDLDLDSKNEAIAFSKPPLEIALRTKKGADLRLIGVHAKSKAPHGARNLKDKIRISIANRRKQLAQCIWLRQRVDAHLTKGDDMIVLGDFNDGPGLDEYEKLFGRSSVEVVMGDDRDVALHLHDPHAKATLLPRPGVLPATSRFYLAHEKRYLNALLDYVMVSTGLAARAPRWHIWHPFDDIGCFENPELQAALLTASDHFPVTLDIDL